MIGYARLGRSQPLLRENCGSYGGDDEAITLLTVLAERHPEIEWRFVSRNSGESPEEAGLPSNVTNPWNAARREVLKMGAKVGSDLIETTKRIYGVAEPMFQDLDGLVVWMGQHGTSNMPIPKVGTGWTDDDLTNPQVSFVNYCSFILLGINKWRDVDPLARQEVWLKSDVRNYMKARDLKWPIANGSISQYVETRKTKHERFGDTRDPADIGFPLAKWDEKDPGVWTHPTEYTYDQLEVMHIRDVGWGEDGFEQRKSFGIIANEARQNVKYNRKDVFKQWVLPLDPELVSGEWTAESQEELGITITPTHPMKMVETLQTLKCTVQTPGSGSGWPTMKTFEAFRAGTVSFIHPYYDNQGHIIPTQAQLATGDIRHTPELTGLSESEFKELATWLRPATPDALKARIAAVSSSEETWRWLVWAQRTYLQRCIERQQAVHEIERRLGL